MTELHKLLINHFPNKPENKKEEMILLLAGMAPREYGFENEALDWLKNHPKASLDELDEFLQERISPLIIVDDDEEY